MESGGWSSYACGKGKRCHMELLCDGERSSGWGGEKLLRWCKNPHCWCDGDAGKMHGCSGSRWNWWKITTKTRQGKGKKWKQTLKVDGRRKRKFRDPHIPYRHLFKKTFLIRTLLKRWIKSTANWVRNPTGVPMLTGRIRVAMNPSQRLCHRWGITHSGGSQQQERSKDCQNSQDVESCSNMKLFWRSMPSSTQSWFRNM